MADFQAFLGVRQKLFAATRFAGDVGANLYVMFAPRLAMQHGVILERLFDLHGVQIQPLGDFRDQFVADVAQLQGELEIVGQVLSVAGEDATAERIVRSRSVRAAVAVGARYLGVALSAIHLDTGVERIVVQGGFAQAMGSGWLAEVAEAAAAAGWPVGPSWPDILQAGHPDDDSALLGAAWYAVGRAG